MNKLKSNMLLMLCGNVILALSQWVLIAGLNYSNAVEEVGRYSYSLALAGLFLTVGQVGVRQYLMSTDIPISHVRQLYVTRLLMSVLTFVLLLLYASLFVDTGYFWVVVFLGLAKIIENMSDLAHGFYLRRFDIYQITQSRVVRSTFSPIAFLGIYYISNNLVLSSVGLCIAWLVSYMWIDRAGFSSKDKNIHEVDQITSILKIAYPMGVTSVLVLLSINIPLFVLAEKASDLDMGHYASVFYLVTAGSLLIQSALQVLSPIFIGLIKDSLVLQLIRLSSKSYLLSIVYGVAVILLAGLMGEWLLVFLYGTSFVGLGNLVTLAAYLNFMLAVQAVGGIILTALGVFRYQMWVMAASIVVGAVTSLWLVPVQGVTGAFIAGTIAAAFNAALFGLKVFQELHKK